MAVHSLYPAYVQIFYQSAYGSHVMTRPTRQWVGTPWTTAGEYTAWDETNVPADDMIEALIAAALPLLKDTCEFTGYIIYTVASADADGVPVYAKQLSGQVGTSASTDQDKGFAKTYSYLTAGNNKARLVLLDVPTGGIVSKSGSLPPGDERDFADTLIDPQWAWAGRDGEQIVVMRSVSNDVNDALQRRYRI